ncbi:MAG: hypothetical protein J6B92_07455 [Paraprevotella sp.]|nr:hypothetical protein [Paraprevotella sp.]
MAHLCHTRWYDCAIRYDTTVPYVMVRLCHTLWYDCAIRYDTTVSITMIRPSQ